MISGIVGIFLHWEVVAAIRHRGANLQGISLSGNDERGKKMQ